MSLRPKARVTLLAAALAASAASAYAAYTSSFVPAYTPPPNAAEENRSAYVAPQPARVADEHALAPNERLVVPQDAPVAAKQPYATTVRVAEPAPPRSEITITEPRLTEDQRIQADVMDLLARNPNLSGKIGVVAEDRVVTLTGYTTTSSQAWRAGRDARGVYGVRHVVNEIRPRVGGITS